jgi:hypothetical protein
MRTEELLQAHSRGVPATADEGFRLRWPSLQHNLSWFV